MPATYQIIEPRNLVYIRFDGILGSVEVLRTRAALVTDPAYRAGLVELIDMRTTNAVDFGMVGMLNIVRQYQELFDKHGYPVCMVIFAPGDLGYGMARMFESLTSDDIRFKPILTQTRDEAAAELERAGITEAHQLLDEL
ncbi:hypothetical protein [Aliiroseovarius sp.]|uniref:hypothetical protein n=1 Tax=Aliiroseovarius sp. TaxID=1872442 RepID=UPI003BAC4C7F